MGIFPLEKDLVWWLNSKWKPKCQVDLNLGSTRSFTTIFCQIMKGRENTFEDGPYFLN